jgi:hypothetical protein
MRLTETRCSPTSATNLISNQILSREQVSASCNGPDHDECTFWLTLLAAALRGSDSLRLQIESLGRSQLTDASGSPRHTQERCQPSAEGSGEGDAKT